MPTTASDDGGELGETAMVGATERSHRERSLQPHCSTSTSALLLLGFGGNGVYYYHVSLLQITELQFLVAASWSQIRKTVHPDHRRILY
jgi:hypothetical protein